MKLLLQKSNYFPLNYNMSTCREERRDSYPHRPLFYRVLRAAFPLHLLFFMLLVLACLVPLSEEDYSCTLSNNFARSFYPMLRYTNGPPPTWEPPRLWEFKDWKNSKEAALVFVSEGLISLTKFLIVFKNVFIVAGAPQLSNRKPYHGFVMSLFYVDLTCDVHIFNTWCKEGKVKIYFNIYSIF